MHHNAFSVRIVGSAHEGQDSSYTQQLDQKMSFKMPQAKDFENPEDFLSAQRTLRVSNLQSSGGQKVLMASHCWRNPETQASKRRLIAALSLNGWSHWSDFLDLQATGPVPWRKEIEDGIRDSAKVVMFVDRAYLLSFNCLQEVAFAVAFNKPIVVIILEQAAIELLTSACGASDAWSELAKFEGKLLTPEIGDGRPFSKDELATLYNLLSSINFCMCRPLDFQNDTAPVVLRRMYDFVSVELAYQKEHALLQSKALEWEKYNREPSRLLNEEAVIEYEVWVKQAKERKQVPPPTLLQETFLQHGKKRAQRSLRIRQALMITTFLITVVGGLAIFLAMATVDAQHQKGIAEKNAEEAQNQKGIAERNEKEAETQGRRAQQNALNAQKLEKVATARQYLLAAKFDSSTLCCYPQAALREATTLTEGLPVAVQADVRTEVVSFGNQLLERAVLYPVAGIEKEYSLQFVEARGLFGRWRKTVSPDNRWAAHWGIIDSDVVWRIILHNRENGSEYALDLGGWEFSSSFDVSWQTPNELLLLATRDTSNGSIAILKSDCSMDVPGKVTRVLELGGIPFENLGGFSFAPGMELVKGIFWDLEDDFFHFGGTIIINLANRNTAQTTWDQCSFCYQFAPKILSRYPGDNFTSNLNLSVWSQEEPTDDFFSPNARIFATVWVSNDGYREVWVSELKLLPSDVQVMPSLRVGKEKASWVRFSWSPDGKRITTDWVSRDSYNEVWVSELNLSPIDVQGMPSLRVGKEKASWVRFFWSPDGKRVITRWFGDDGTVVHVSSLANEHQAGHTIEVARIPAEHELPELGDEYLYGNFLRPNWSPDGESIFMEWPETLGKEVVQRVSSFNFSSPPQDATIPREHDVGRFGTAAVRGEREHSAAYSWSPDGRWIVTCIAQVKSYSEIDDESECVVNNVIDSHPEPASLSVVGRVVFVDWKSDSSSLQFYAILKDDSEAKIHAQLVTPTNMMWEGHGALSSLQWSPDGTRLLTSSFDDETVKIWTRSDGSSRVLLQGRYPHASWSPDGSRVAVCEETGVTLLVDMQGAVQQRLDTGIACADVLTRSANVQATFSHDGKRLVWKCRTSGTPGPLPFFYIVRIGVWDMTQVPATFREFQKWEKLPVYEESLAVWSADDEDLALTALISGTVSQTDTFWEGDFLSGLNSVLAVIHVDRGEIKFFKTGEGALSNFTKDLRGTFRGLWASTVAWSPHRRMAAVGGTDVGSSGIVVPLPDNLEDFEDALWYRSYPSGLSLRVFELGEDGELQSTISGSTSKAISHVVWSADGHRIFTYGESNVLEWDITSECIWSVQLIEADLHLLSVKRLSEGSGNGSEVVTAERGTGKFLFRRDSRAVSESMFMQSTLTSRADLDKKYGVNQTALKCAVPEVPVLTTVP